MSISVRITKHSSKRSALCVKSCGMKNEKRFIFQSSYIEIIEMLYLKNIKYIRLFIRDIYFLRNSLLSSWIYKDSTEIEFAYSLIWLYLISQFQSVSCISGIHLLIRCEVLHSRHCCQINRKVNDQRVRSFTNSISRVETRMPARQSQPRHGIFAPLATYFPLGDNETVSRDTFVRHKFDDYAEMREISMELKKPVRYDQHWLDTGLSDRFFWEEKRTSLRERGLTREP